jgi:hypothetical protein
VPDLEPGRKRLSLGLGRSVSQRQPERRVDSDDDDEMEDEEARRRSRRRAGTLERSVSMRDELMRGGASAQDYKMAFLFVEGWRSRLRQAGDLVERERWEWATK